MYNNFRKLSIKNGQLVCNELCNYILFTFEVIINNPPGEPDFIG